MNVVLELLTASVFLRKAARGIARFGGVVALVGGMLWCAHAAATTRDVTQLLEHADDIKTSDHLEFSRLLQQLSARSSTLAPGEQSYLKFLRGWELTYRGDCPAATEELQDVAKQATDPALQYRAQATIANCLQVSSRYEQALLQLSDLVSALPAIKDQRARQQILGVATITYTDVGMYDLALKYAKLRQQQAQGPSDRCHAAYGVLNASAMRETSGSLVAQLQDGIALCMRAGDTLFANAIRVLLVRRMLDAGKPEEAITDLSAHYAEVQQTDYAELIAKFDSLLGLAYWNSRDLEQAQHYATRASQAGVLDAGAKSFGRAYRVLYLVAKQRGDDTSALTWHEKYMAADTAYSSEASAKALAIQKVNQQVLAKERHIEALNDQNRILGLQQTLSETAAETTRLYASLLVLILLAVTVWGWRTKRSQVTFRKLARRDSLTGIFNRQHFMDAARAALQYASKSTRESCLILLDLDHFKQVNDDHGHATGDSVLKRAVSVCARELHSVDLFGRLGGEEFGILVPDCGLDEGASRAEHMRLAIASRASNDMPEVSASFGVASTLHGGHDLRDLLAHADAALYRAKRAGRNTVAVSDADPVTASAINV